MSGQLSKVNPGCHNQASASIPYLHRRASGYPWFMTAWFFLLNYSYSTLSTICSSVRKCKQRTPFSEIMMTVPNTNAKYEKQR
ncbi:hypothetical protein CH063_09897 [Colletotrichum higginsianum]|uniref:Uncharacterized protein n=1 Tax=Colletotrichum higginsianum (strain IMI 349063) TaxID=759273 RepID=H1VFC1_COLHI|nr:hypothetical protein CH063_09897 [Colletotrichum higginsianum]